MKTNKYVATTLAGLENVLAKELVDLGAEDVQPANRAVYFSGDTQMMYRANYFLRTALRILFPIAEFRFRTPDDLYRKAKNICWEEQILIDQSFVIHHTIFSDLFKNSMFASMKLKDAIVDRFREQFNKRPSIDPRNPDIQINLHIANDLCTISLDSTGDSLHKRGYRLSQTEAPISEVLAAGLIKLSGWDAKQNFVDPMCGSGTIAIEAALIATNTPPGSFRKEFAFQKWPSYRKVNFEAVVAEAESHRPTCKIFASDISRFAIDTASKNASSAGMDQNIHFKISDFKHLNTEIENPFLLFNPPYGERLESGDADFYSMVGERLKHHYEEATAWIISTPECLKTIGLKPSQKISILNGSIPCSFRKFELYRGSRKANYQQ